MTTATLCYLIVGALAILWPLAIILLRREVLLAQWLMCGALLFFALSMILYSTLFNNFLKGEYLLVILFFIFALATPPVTYVAIKRLMSPVGVTRVAMRLVLPPAVLAVLLAASVAVGGSDMYLQWIERGADAEAGFFYAGSWRYNVIVVAHFYLFTAVLIYEMAYMLAVGIRQMHKYRLLLADYYAPSSQLDAPVRHTYVGILMLSVAITISYLLFPFNVSRPDWVAIVTALFEGAVVLMVGWNVYAINVGVERLPLQGHKARARTDLKSAALQLVKHMEQEQTYLNPDLSVPMLADELHMTEDDVIDGIHLVQGLTFGDYLDSLRVDHAIRLLSGRTWQLDNPEQLRILAHSSGYLEVDDMQKAFLVQTRMSVTQWYDSRGGGKV